MGAPEWVPQNRGSFLPLNLTPTPGRGEVWVSALATRVRVCLPSHGRLGPEADIQGADLARFVETSSVNS